MAKILIVDDEKEIVSLYHDVLSKQGFNVLTASNGVDCLSLAAKALPDLILLDVIMPGMDGGTTAQKLLENAKTKNIPIIFLTSMITKEEEAVQEGIIKGRLFISKASSIEEFIEKINKVLAIGT